MFIKEKHTAIKKPYKLFQLLEQVEFSRVLPNKVCYDCIDVFYTL